MYTFGWTRLDGTEENKKRSVCHENSSSAAEDEGAETQVIRAHAKESRRSNKKSTAVRRNRKATIRRPKGDGGTSSRTRSKRLQQHQKISKIERNVDYLRDQWNLRGSNRNEEQEWVSHLPMHI